MPADWRMWRIFGSRACHHRRCNFLNSFTATEGLYGLRFLRLTWILNRVQLGSRVHLFDHEFSMICCQRYTICSKLWSPATIWLGVFECHVGDLQQIPMKYEGQFTGPGKQRIARSLIAVATDSAITDRAIAVAGATTRSGQLSMYMNICKHNSKKIDIATKKYVIHRSR